MGTYIVEYDYTAKASDELTIRKGEIITDALPAEDGWLKGECRGAVGYFPSNFVIATNREKAKNRTFIHTSTGNKNDTLRKRSHANNDSPSPSGTLFQVKVVYTYLPVHDDELPIKPNDVINVTRLVEEGWYEGVFEGQVGLFPSNYVTRIQEDRKKSSQVNKDKPVPGLSALVRNEAAKKNTPIKARVLYDYKATASDELTLTADEIVTILEKNLEDEGWWKGEINGRVGVFPDNYVEEISATTNLKHRSSTPEILAKQPSQTLPSFSKTKANADDTSHNYSNEPYHHQPKTKSISDEEGPTSQNLYSNTTKQDSADRSDGKNDKQRVISTNRPPSTRKNDNGLNRTTGSFDETSRPQPADHKNERKLHTPSPPSVQRDAGQLESPRYTNRSYSLSTTNNSTMNSTVESPMNAVALEQMQKDLIKLQSNMDEMKSKFNEQVRELTHELDEEKKVRLSLQTEIERLQRLVQKSSQVR